MTNIDRIMTRSIGQNGGSLSDASGLAVVEGCFIGKALEDSRKIGVVIKPAQNRNIRYGNAGFFQVSNG